MTIDVLREEGMYNDNGDMVVDVIKNKKALLEVPQCILAPPHDAPAVVFALDGRGGERRGTDGRPDEVTDDELSHSRRATGCREAAGQPVRRLLSLSSPSMFTWIFTLSSRGWEGIHKSIRGGWD